MQVGAGRVDVGKAVSAARLRGLWLGVVRFAGLPGGRIQICRSANSRVKAIPRDHVLPSSWLEVGTELGRCEAGVEFIGKFSEPAYGSFFAERFEVACLRGQRRCARAGKRKGFGWGR